MSSTKRVLFPAPATRRGARWRRRSCDSWSFPDPAEENDAKQERAFEGVFRGLEERIRLLVTVGSK
jgi:hypothetical protein